MSTKFRQGTNLPVTFWRLVAASSLMVLLQTSGSAVPATAHPSDVIRAGRRAGPLHLGETTRSEARAMFGAPDRRKLVSFGCVEAKKLIWRNQLVGTFWRGEDHPVLQVKIDARRVRTVAGEPVRIHTRKGLRVWDPLEKLRRLYPDATFHPHKGRHRHWLLYENRQKGRLWGTTAAGHVTRIATEFFEAC